MECPTRNGLQTPTDNTVCSSLAYSDCRVCLSHVDVSGTVWVNNEEGGRFDEWVDVPQGVVVR